MKIMKKFFAYIVKFFQYLPQILSILSGLNSLLSMFKEKQDSEQQKLVNNEQKTKIDQEKPKPDESTTKPMFDKRKLNYLENKAYFLANVGTLKEFGALSEDIKTLDPDLFRKQFPKVVKEKNTETNSETSTEKATTIVDEKYQQRKNELLNKVTFIVNKCGMSSDFEQLPDDVRTMDPVLFKEKSKDCKF
jgi:hypothetical protein